MIIDDEAYHAILDRFDVIVAGGTVYMSIDSLKIVNDSLTESIVAAAPHLSPEQFWGMASVIEMYNGMFDTLLSRNAAEMVPDDLSDFHE